MTDTFTIASDIARVVAVVMRHDPWRYDAIMAAKNFSELGDALGIPANENINTSYKWALEKYK